LWDAVEPVLYTAEKYNMPGLASIVHALLRTPAFSDEPLRLYSAACHFGWAEDVCRASTMEYHRHQALAATPAATQKSSVSTRTCTCSSPSYA
jgi:hypothetical protein